ncbi:hypothetical protein E3N88_03781 [Mikania micrantha]|uniref:Uncharacterized protein n=1 Tax=Mikania micrantha TaxID=192012 RepID=A0A5N6PTG8_9ASTR|nr:hypothetical protein E3N88_03781 [Mikania micrantha]
MDLCMMASKLAYEMLLLLSAMVLTMTNLAFESIPISVKASSDAMLQLLAGKYLFAHRIADKGNNTSVYIHVLAPKISLVPTFSSHLPMITTSSTVEAPPRFPQTQSHLDCRSQLNDIKKTPRLLLFSNSPVVIRHSPPPLPTYCLRFALK